MDIRRKVKNCFTDTVAFRWGFHKHSEFIGKETQIIGIVESTSEDYSEYLKHAPGVFNFVGGRNESKGFIHLVHHSCFDVDYRALEVVSA